MGLNAYLTSPFKRPLLPELIFDAATQLVISVIPWSWIYNSLLFSPVGPLPWGLNSH